MVKTYSRVSYPTAPEPKSWPRLSLTRPKKRRPLPRLNREALSSGGDGPLIDALNRSEGWDKYLFRLGPRSSCPSVSDFLSLGHWMSKLKQVFGHDRKKRLSTQHSAGFPSFDLLARQRPVNRFFCVRPKWGQEEREVKSWPVIECVLYGTFVFVVSNFFSRLSAFHLPLFAWFASNVNDLNGLATNTVACVWFRITGMMSCLPRRWANSRLTNASFSVIQDLFDLSSSLVPLPTSLATN